MDVEKINPERDAIEGFLKRYLTHLRANLEAVQDADYDSVIKRFGEIEDIELLVRTLQEIAASGDNEETIIQRVVSESEQNIIAAAKAVERMSSEDLSEEERSIVQAAKYLLEAISLYATEDGRRSILEGNRALYDEDELQARRKELGDTNVS